MGVSTSWTQLAGKLQAAGATTSSVPYAATRTACLTTAGIIKAGSPSRLRGVGKNGARLGIRTWVTGGAANTLGYVRATGPWQLIEGDTRPHEIPRSNRRKAKVLKLGDDFRHRVQHPGTSGKHPFEKGARAAMPLIPRIYQQAEHQALAAVFL